MNVSVISITCSQCEYKFKGYLQGQPLSNVDYLTSCPSCKNEIQFSNKAGWSEHSAPEGAVEILAK